MYDHAEIEAKWQAIWEQRKAFLTPEDAAKTKYYCLDMFPYPSGDGLHIGHTRIYTASDIISRLKRAQGYSVLHPMGWDAFGLPTENYAIKTGTQPKVITEQNINTFRRQMRQHGFSYDWSREVNTTDPHYYKWTQWIFLQLFKQGLAYQDTVAINWCPKDKTGLANEEVVNGRCDRCGTVVERREMQQWLLKITDYAEQLLADLKNLDWPEKIKRMQVNWIGKSEGMRVKFEIASDVNTKVEVFTTRPDTLFGATYLVLAPEHKLVEKLTTEEQKSAVAEYIKVAGQKSDLERTDLQKTKTGVFSGSFAINPVNNKEIPIWIADYVLASYGTGAIMAVPAEDERDAEFAEKYHLPVVPVIVSDENTKIIADLEQNGITKSETNYRLRDWVFSRQRYWGEPIPIVHCPKCGAVAVPEEQLPLQLPEVDRYQPTGTGESPLAAVEEWVNTECPNCGGPAKRETDTMPQWAGSSWYYLRFIDPHNPTELADKKLLKHWIPVDCYVGGAEHAVLHLLYARFWHKFLHDQGIVPGTEPFKRLESVGIVSSNAYKDKEGKWVHYNDVTLDGEMAFEKKTGEVLSVTVEKMSKSKGNVISPDFVIEKYGADVLRVYSMFMGPWSEVIAFDLKGLEGSVRFLKKVYALLDIVSYVDTEPSLENARLLNESIKKVTNDIEQFHFNTAVSQLMILTNAIIEQQSLTEDQLSVLVQLLAPFAPHIAEEMWQKLGHTNLVMEETWPEAQTMTDANTETEVIVQVNGKVRDRITVKVGLDTKDLENLALDLPRIKELTKSGIVKVITVPDKLVNIVVK